MLHYLHAFCPLLLSLTAEGIKMLQDDGLTDVDPLGDLNTELERRLGKIVKDKYGTDFYILHRYPMAVSDLSVFCL
jgi:aspartyl-tRNA synthetase